MLKIYFFILDFVKKKNVKESLNINKIIKIFVCFFNPYIKELNNLKKFKVLYTIDFNF